MTKNVTLTEWVQELSLRGFKTTENQLANVIFNKASLDLRNDSGEVYRIGTSNLSQIDANKVVSYRV